MTGRRLGAMAVVVLAGCAHTSRPVVPPNSLGPGVVSVVPPSGSGLAGAGPAGASRSAAPVGALVFSFDSLDDHPVTSAALRGKPTVIAFVASDDLASQAEAGFFAAMAKNDGNDVNYVLVAVEAPEQRELVESFRRFFETKTGVSLRTGMADKDTLAGLGPFGDVRRLTVLLLDKTGKVAWLKTGIAKAEEIRAALGRL